MTYPPAGEAAVGVQVKLPLPLVGQPAPVGAVTVKLVLVVPVIVTVNVWELPSVMFAVAGLMLIPTPVAESVVNVIFATFCTASDDPLPGFPEPRMP